jgi:glycosyltransferase involved in cell wall biosynthesis
MTVGLSHVVAPTVFRMLALSSDNYPPQRVDVSVLFGEELSGRGHRIDWVLQSEAVCARSYVTAWHGGTVWVGPTDLGASLFNRIRKHVRGIVHDLRVYKLARAANYDFVMVKDKFVSGLSALFAARLFRLRFVYWLSYPFPESYLLRARDGTARYPFLYRIRGWVFHAVLYRALLPAADHIFVQSEQMRRDVAAQGIAASKITAVPMGIRAASFAVPAAAAREVVPVGERCFLYLGTLTRVRRLSFIIRVLALVTKELPDVKLYVVGSGDDPRDEQELIDEAARLGVSSSLVMVGQLPHADALRYVLEADICVSPFFPTPILNSTSPTKLIEYMAMGKAVVANDHPEQRLVIEESGAGYCVPYRENEFAKAVVTLFRAPDLARTMGARGRQYAAEHRTYRSIADLVELELLRVADRRTRLPSNAEGR